MSIPFHEREFFDEHIDWISEHIDQYFPGAETTVFHEMFAADFKVHVYFIKPANSTYNILLTEGMSTLAMNVDDSVENKDDYKFAELMLLIPKDIEFDDLYTPESKNGYIITMLKETARFPHHYDTWIGEGHSIVTSPEMEPYSPETRFVGGVILPSVTFGEDVMRIRREGGVINIYSFYPVYEDEVRYKMEHGYQGFLQLLIDNDAEEILNNNRPSLVG
jgi:hypothetical protein